MKIISWNVNSVRIRMHLLKDLIQKRNPDIICLQEIKVEEFLFPKEEIIKLGYNFIEISGEKSYNGVAIISKLPIHGSSAIDILNYGHKRHISTTIDTKVGKIDLHNFYVPAGGDIADPIANNKFDHKLKFLDWMNEFFSQQKQKKIIIVGDFNIAPLPNDVWSHKQLIDVVSHTPIEVEKLNKIKSSIEFIDTHRQFISEHDKLYSWWSYRALDPVKSNRGRRLDHIWATSNLKNYLVKVENHTEYRTMLNPSDHIPIESEFDF